MDAQDKGGKTPLWAAFISGHQKIVRLLKEANVDVERLRNKSMKYYGSGKAPLLASSDCGHEKTSQLLLEKKIEKKNE